MINIEKMNGKKGLLADEAVNALVFFACVIIIGIFFYVSGINPLSVMGPANDFINQARDAIFSAILSFI